MFLFRKKPSNKNNESNVFETKENDIAISKKDDDKPKIELSGKSTAVCKIGDALSCPGHIALIVGIDEANKRYIIAEENSGLSLSSIPFNGSRYYGDEQYFCESLSDKYTN